MKTKACLFQNVNLETKQTRTWHMWNKNPTRFYYKK